jgi:filamentous hemagglutinin family protein
MTSLAHGSTRARSNNPLRLWESAGRIFPALGAMALLAAAPAAHAQLTNAQVVAGDAQFERNGANTVIRAANGTIINYNAFNIRQGESVRFIQPGASSRVLNRITGPDPSRIAGTLTSNGIVYIVNPAGVYFAHGALVNVGGLYASAGHITNADFLAGNNRFTGLTGSAENRGTIHASEVHLLGKQVANFGTIVAPEGLVTMTAGDDVYLGEDGGQIYARIDDAAGAQQAGSAVTQAGTVDAAGGRVLLGAGDMFALAIEHTGVTRGRDVRLDGGSRGTVTVAGTIDASNQGAGRTGGDVQVLGRRVGVIDGRIDASGETGGGTILVGGDAHGQGGVPTAERAVVSTGSSLDASATRSGDGGKVVVWSDKATAFRGSLDVRGGAESGDGGFAEVSGKENLLFGGQAQTHSRAGGDNGSLLLDPRDITVQAGTGPDDAEVSDNQILFGDGGAATDFVIGADTLGALTGNILLQAQRDFTLLSGVALTLGGVGAGQSFTVLAGNDISILGTLASGGGINLSANDNSGGSASGSGRVIIDGNVSTIAGDITLGGASIELGANLTAGGGNVSLTGPVNLTADSTLAGHDISFSSTIDGAQSLRLDSSGGGTNTFGGAIGGSTPLAALRTNAEGSSLFQGDISADTVDIGDAAVLGTSLTVNAPTLVRFQRTVDSEAAEANTLTLNSPLTTLLGAVGAAGADTALGSLTTDTDGVTRLSTSALKAATVTFNDDVSIVGDSTITATTSATFAQLVDSAAGQHKDLTVESPDTFFQGAVGASADGELGALTTDAAGQTRIDAAEVRAQDLALNDAVEIQRDTTLAGSTSLLVAGTLDSQSGEANDLTIDSPDATLSGGLGTLAGGAFGTLTTGADGSTTIAGTINTDIAAFNGNVVVGDDATLAATTSATFGAALNSEQDERNDLEIISPTTTFSGTVGGDSGGALGDLHTDAAGLTTIDSRAMTATRLRFDDAVEVGASTVLTGSSQVRFGRTLDSVTGEATGVSINSPQTIFVGAVGATESLGTLFTDAPGQTIIGSPTIRVENATFADDVTLTSDLHITATGNVGFSGAVNSQANQHRSLTTVATSTFLSGGAGTGTGGQLGSLQITGSASLGGTIDTQNDQAYSGPVLLSFDTIIQAPNVTFDGTINSATTADRSLTVNTSGAGITRFNGNIGALNPLRAITTNENGSTVFGAVTIFTSGAQTYSDRVLLAGNTTLSASQVRFDSTVNSFAAPRSLTVNTVAGGATVFTGAVGAVSALSSLTTDAGGTTRIEGGRVVTTGLQAYNDDVIITADTTLDSTGVTFGKTLNSGTDRRSLTVNTGGDGVTSFGGTVGASSELSSISVDAGVTSANAGSVRFFGASVRTSGDQTYNHHAFIDRAITFQGNDITFNFGLDSNVIRGPVALTITTTASGVTSLLGPIGGTTGIAGLSTNSDGRTVLGDSLGSGVNDSVVHSTGPVIFGDAVEAHSSTSIFSDSNIAFGSTLNAASGDTTGPDVLLVPDLTSGGTAENASVPRIVFGGDVGGVTPLGSLTLGGDLSVNPAVATIGAGIGSDNKPIPGFSLAITTRRGFTMGRGQRFTVLGDLTINAGAEARLGDISVLGGLDVNAPSIALLTRERERTVVPRSGALVSITDAGLDYVAGEHINFSTAPTILGDGPAPSFGTPGGTSVSGNLQGFAQRDTAGLTTDQLASGPNFLDAVASGPANVNLAESLATAVPPGLIGADVAEQSGATESQAQELARLGIPTRPTDRAELLGYLSGAGLYVDFGTPTAGASDTAVAINRLPASVVSRVLADYRAVFSRETTDAQTGEPTRENNAAHVSGTLSASWAEYSGAVGPKADAVGFRAYVEAVPTQAESLYYMDALRRLFTDIGYLGLTPGESRRARDAILSAINVRGMSRDQLEAAIVTQALGTPAQ